MYSIWHLIYNGIVLPLFSTAIFISRIFNEKVRRGLAGRKNLFPALTQAVSALGKEGPRFWIHSSSMGEFEQARPLIAKLKERFPEGTVIVTVFSPSAYDHLQDYRTADYLCYLPLDTKKNAEKFIDIVNPDAGVVIRHDIWPNHLYQLQKRGIPCILVNCSIRQSPSLWLRLAPGSNRYLHGAFDEIHTISPAARDYCEAKRWGRGPVEVIGDTRYDQVIFRARQAETIVEPLRTLKNGRPGFVMGSTWPSDESVLFDALARLRNDGTSLWMVVVPHEPTAEHLGLIEERLAKLGFHSLRLSEVQQEHRDTGDVLIVDRVGILASLYALGELCYVGGGFGPGIHNVLEPAALGKVVLFGPRNGNSYEAGQLIQKGVGFACSDTASMYETLKQFLDDPARMVETGKKAEAIVNENRGASERIIHRLTRLIAEQ
ncbi:hypothetical protein JXO52_10010 [bacterium]|nr:hypothetical protein [bacterium]